MQPQSVVALGQNVNESHQVTKSDTNQTLLKAESVRQICGGISRSTFERLVIDPTKGFPRSIKLGQQRFWRESDLIDWLDAQYNAAREEAGTQ